MYGLMEALYPICRSITGNGVRETLKIISKYIPLEIHEVPTGTKVFDWTIPKEWNINDAYVIDPDGKKIIDFKKSNLHVLNYSIPIHKKIPLSELKNHIQTLPEQPDVIPYRTSYYAKNWGFCMRHNEFLKLKDGEYEVVIDSSFKDGSLTYGEYYIKGKSDDEILISCYVCHPSLCNDNLSGVVLTTVLAKSLNTFANNYSIRFLFIPETIGAITWLCLNEDKTSKIKHGLVATCVGDPGKFTYKRSRQGNAIIDRVVTEILKNSHIEYEILNFFPLGSDERQFCSPGFNLPVGSLCRSIYASPDFPQYHNSSDNLQLVTKSALIESYSKYLEIIYHLEQNIIPKSHSDHQTNKIYNYTKSLKNDEKFLSLNPKCEPQLGKRGLYSLIGALVPDQSEQSFLQQALLWVLNFSDGNNSLIDIAERSGIDFKLIKKSANLLLENKLLKISNN